MKVRFWPGRETREVMWWRRDKGEKMLELLGATVFKEKKPIGRFTEVHTRRGKEKGKHRNHRNFKRGGLEFGLSRVNHLTIKRNELK